MYGVRYVGYSFITCAWYAFPFEALEVFTLYLMRVAQAAYIKVTVQMEEFYLSNKIINQNQILKNVKSKNIQTFVKIIGMSEKL